MVFVLEWIDLLYGAGHLTPVPAAEGADSTRSGWEDLRAADPEVLVVACCGHDVERTRRDVPILESLPGWRGLRAVRERRAYLADGSAYFSRPGPRVVDTLELLAGLLHPGACPMPTADRAVPAY